MHTTNNLIKNLDRLSDSEPMQSFEHRSGLNKGKQQQRNARCDGAKHLQLKEAGRSSRGTGLRRLSCARHVIHRNL
jgi:hypothetical protein